MVDWGIAIVGLALAIWIGLVFFWGRFWWADQRLATEATVPPLALAGTESYPTVWAVVPARDEASVLPETLRSLLRQDYPGPFSIILVDDQSTDGTAAIAQHIAETVGQPERLTILSGQPLPAGWTGKLWAMEQGIQAAQRLTAASTPPAYFLLTDADIQHSVSNLRQLVTKAEAEQLELTSLMVLLRCQSLWEKLLIPAFVFFFQMLYPFPWVNDPTRRQAAAAGGCVLIRRQALERIGGIGCLRTALIDDCTLAATVKTPTSSPLGSPTSRAVGPYHPIWIGLTTTTHSLRPYPSLKSIWDMVARTAYTQLGYSPQLLLGTVIGMIWVYLVAPLSVVYGLTTGNTPMTALGTLTWGLMALAYWPTLRLYQGSPLLAPALPLIGLLYTLMTLDSARQHWQGQGGAWKGRVYDGSGNSVM